MKVCQLSTVEHVGNFIAPLCHALRDAGHVVVIACNLEHDGRELERYLGPGFPAHRIRGARQVTLRAATVDVLALARYLRRERFDVVHVHGPLVAVQARLAARLAAVPVVVSHAHGFYFHQGTRPSRRVALQSLERSLCRHLTDHLVTVSDEDHRLATAQRFRPDPGDIVATPGVGVDTGRFRPVAPGDAADRRRLRVELATDDDAVVVTFVGRLVAEKGLPELVAAMTRLAVRRPEVVLWLVGDVLASERDRGTPDQLRASLVGTPADGRVRWLGRRSDVPQVLRASDVGVLPSHREGLPVSVLEAMACGLPVVATDIRGCRELVVAGETGALVPVGDVEALTRALERLAGDAALRGRWGEAGRRRILGGYTVAHGLAPLTDLYDRIDRRLTAEDGGQHAGQDAGQVAVRDTSRFRARGDRRARGATPSAMR